MWFAANYAASGSLPIDVQSALSSSFVEGGVGQSGGRESYGGLYDTKFALTLRLVDELGAPRRTSPRAWAASWPVPTTRATPYALETAATL